MYRRILHCRWCGKRYNAKKPHDRDGFCCAKHKQAHHRAWHKYVTSVSQFARELQARRSRVK